MPRRYADIRNKISNKDEAERCYSTAVSAKFLFVRRLEWVPRIFNPYPSDCPTATPGNFNQQVSSRP